MAQFDIHEEGLLIYQKFDWVVLTLELDSQLTVLFSYGSLVELDRMINTNVKLKFNPIQNRNGYLLPREYMRNDSEPEQS